MTKYIKYFLRAIIIAPFILGIPTGHKIIMLSESSPNYKLSVFESIVSIPGIFSCCIIFLFLIIAFVGFSFQAIHWVFNNKTDTYDEYH